MKSRILLMGGLTLVAGAVHAQDYEAWARVTNTAPRYERVNVPEEQCRTEYVPVTVTADSSANYTGAVIGGVTGGLLGSTLGRGNGKVATAAAGAVIGSIVGNNIQNTQAYANAGTEPVRRCAVVDRWEQRLNGYHVAYDYAGRTYEAVLPYDPGPRIRVRVAVEPVVDQADAIPMRADPIEAL
jgi:uncharacterized protein YcfJ